MRDKFTAKTGVYIPVTPKLLELLGDPLFSDDEGKVWSKDILVYGTYIEILINQSFFEDRVNILTPKETSYVVALEADEWAMKFLSEEPKTAAQKAQYIVHDRKDKKEREYGPMIECMKKAQGICKNMGIEISVRGLYIAMIAIKLSREGQHHKEDNIVDAIAYLSSMNEMIGGENE